MNRTRTGTEAGRAALRCCLSVILILSGAALAPQAAAHDGATGIVKERMAMMTALGKTMKSLRAMANTDTHLDARILRQAAAEIRAHGGRMPQIFPAGSFAPPSEALPAIENRRREFNGLAEELGERGRGLAILAGTADRAGLRKWYRETGRLCSACHKSFREKR